MDSLDPASHHDRDIANPEPGQMLRLCREGSPFRIMDNQSLRAKRDRVAVGGLRFLPGLQELPGPNRSVDACPWVVACLGAEGRSG